MYEIYPGRGGAAIRAPPSISSPVRSPFRSPIRSPGLADRGRV